MTYDDDDGAGVDFEPYPEFMDGDEATAWLRAWTGNATLTGDDFRVFGQDGTGGYAAIWLAREDEPLENQPIVFFGSEGELGVVASNLADYLWVLAGGFGPLEAATAPEADRELQMELGDLAAKYAADAEKSARDAIRIAREAFPEFEPTVRAWCRA